MRANKYAIIITSVLSALSLIIAIVLNCFSTPQFGFTINLLIGVFASGIVALVVSIISYAAERRNTLERFASQIERLMRAIRDYKSSNDYQQMVPIIKDLSLFDYLALDFAFGDMCFLFFNKRTHKYVFNCLYKPTLNLRNSINRFIFNIESQNDINAAKTNLKEIDELLLFQGKEIILDNDEKTRIIIPPYNKMYIDLGRELYGRYRKIMYPFEKDKEKQNET